MSSEQVREIAAHPSKKLGPLKIWFLRRILERYPIVVFFRPRPACNVHIGGLSILLEAVVDTPNMGSVETCKLKEGPVHHGTFLRDGDLSNTAPHEDSLLNIGCAVAKALMSDAKVSVINGAKAVGIQMPRDDEQAQ